MKIYFTGSIRGGRDDKEIYLEMINHLKKHGEVLTEHIGNKKLSSEDEDLSDRVIHDRDLNWLDAADILVAEVSTPSHGVGFEIRVSVEQKKPILCLFRLQEGKRLSAMIAGCPGINVKNYNTLEEAKAIIDSFFRSFKKS